LRHWRNDPVLNSAAMDIKSQTNEIKLELKIRNKAIENKSFPSEAVIEEFLKVPNYPEMSAKWILPDINSFIVGINYEKINKYKLHRFILNLILCYRNLHQQNCVGKGSMQ